jgi:hypothetical protein
LSIVSGLDGAAAWNQSLPVTRKIKTLEAGGVSRSGDAVEDPEKPLVADVREGGAELQLMDMNGRELLDLVRLDIHTAQ